MGGTRLVRKALKNRNVAKKRLSSIKMLTSKPVIKNVDIEQIKEEFVKKNATPEAKEEPKTVEKTVEAEKAPKAKAPKAKATTEAKEVKKAAPKKAATKKAAAPKAKKEDDKAAE